MSKQDQLSLKPFSLSISRTEFVECSSSADDNAKIRKIFKSFLILAKINFAPNLGFRDDGGVGLRRNLSAYGRLKSPRKTSGTSRLASPAGGSTNKLISSSSSNNVNVNGGYGGGGNNGSISRPLQMTKKVRTRILCSLCSPSLSL